MFQTQVYLIILCCLTFSRRTCAVAVKSGSAYTGVTVAIHPDIPEDNSIIPNIQNQFTKASRILYDATDGWAYYKEIIIAVPSNWKASYPKVYSDPYQKAEFRIEEQNEQYGDQPYTLQPGGCGEPGEYVHLTPAFLADRSGIEELYGLPERLIVHEWSHLRYGIFDEYGIPGDPKFPLFYFDGGFIRTSVCSEDVKGHMQSEQGSLCALFDDRVTRDCVFVPDMTDRATRASLMSLPYMPSVDRYCSNGDNGSYTHNWRAPTKQNLLCNRRSSWEVVSAHADFATQRKSGEPFTPPTFKLVRVENLPQRFVFVLDVSSSMVNRPLELLKQSAKWVIKDLIKEGSYVGVVTFNGAAKIHQPVIRITGQAQRALLEGQIHSMVASGMTSVGSGIVAALKALRDANLPTEDALLVVITDGAENTAPHIKAVMQQAKDSKAKVLAIAFGSKASIDLEILAAATGHKSVLIADIQGKSTADLDQVFVEAVTTQANVDVQIIQLLNKPFALTRDVTETTVILDYELGKNAVFTLAGQVGQVDLELTSPNGKKYVGSDSVASRDDARIQFKMPTVESGVWRVTIRKKTTASVSVDLSVVSEPRNPKEHPVKIRSWLSNNDVNFGKTELKIFAEATKGSSAVIRAKVEAVVISDKNRRVSILPRDDGAGADSIADDGVYTAYYTDFRADEKRFTVIAQVENHGQAFIKSAKFSAAPTLARRKPRVTPKGPPTQKFKLEEFQVLDEDPDAGLPVGEPAADFERITTGGSFTLTNFIQKDIIRPSAINDLSVVSTGETKDGKKFITLTWTAPGDDLDSGTPSRLEIRVSIEGDKFVKDFSSGHLLEVAHVLNGTMSPQAGRTRQTLTVYLPIEIITSEPAKKSLDLYISAKATDKAGNVADLGNIAAAHFGYEIPICLQKTGLFPKARACGQFFHCSNGQPYLKNCPGGLHYSPTTMRCEWPCSAKCDPRITCTEH